MEGGEHDEKVACAKKKKNEFKARVQKSIS